MTSIEWCQRPGTKGESWNPIRLLDGREHNEWPAYATATAVNPEGT